ncbi:hypothetical protein RND81_04G218300 [Saponaria officinalis]|uniref:DUF7731 domain-containing protein n=1 Tax=Saponaria officinalis TaxID=3572 RepID=A0AAW1LNU3_SAPOF
MAKHGILRLVVFAIFCYSGFAQNPGQLIAKALSCFNANNIYKRCNEPYRLTQSGYINVPFTATNQFCYGPCLSETHLVLDCVDHSLSTFVFYNKATLNTIRSTLQSACGHSHDRGNFNVEEYMQDYYEDEYSSANLPLAPSNLFTFVLATAVFLLTARAVF